MRDIKTHPISTFITLLGLTVSFCLLTAGMLYGERYMTKGQSGSEICTLLCSVVYLSQDINTDQTGEIVDGFRDIVVQNKLKQAGILQDDQEIISDEVLKEGMDTISEECIQEVCDYINSGDVYFVMYDLEPMDQEFHLLQNLCSGYGIEIDVSLHDEVNERETSMMEKRLYKILRYGSMLFSFALAYITLFMWFDKRSHAWYIRRIFGVEKRTLFVEVGKVLVLMTLLACLLMLLICGKYSDLTGIRVLKYVGAACAEALIGILILSVKYIGSRA